MKVSITHRKDEMLFETNQSVLSITVDFENERLVSNEAVTKEMFDSPESLNYVRKHLIHSVMKAVEQKIEENINELAVHPMDKLYKEFKK